MNVDINDILGPINSAIHNTALRQIEGWDGLEMIAERIVIDGFNVTSLEGADGKWSARGVISLDLFNWDDELFGNMRLHLLASGHHDGSGASLDCMVISPHLH